MSMRPGTGRMILGAIATVGGFVATAVSESNAAGGPHIVYIGFIGVGLWWFFTGWYVYTKAQRASRQYEMLERSKRREQELRDQAERRKWQ